MRTRYWSRAGARPLVLTPHRWPWPLLVTGLALLVSALIIPPAAAVRAAGGPAAPAGRAVPAAALAVVSRTLGRDDPAYQAAIRQARLTASDGAAGDSLGASVSISANGNTIAAAAPDATVNGNQYEGAVYVFTKPRGGWQDATQTAKLTASDGTTGDSFGSFFTGDADGVAVSADGNTIVAGAPGPYGGAPGAVYVFTEPRGGWHNETQTAKLTASDAGPGDNLGATVAISGNVIASGAPAATINGNQIQGAVYLFTEPKGGWHDETQTAKLTASDGAAGDFLGNALAMSGRTVIAAATGATVNGNQLEGAAYVFTEPSGGWRDETQAAKLTASDGLPYELFGNSAAISGNVIMIGSDSPDYGGNPGLGAAYIFVRPRSGWQDATQTAELTPSPDTPGTGLGYSVAILGPIALAGGINGVIYVFAETPGGWQNQTQLAELTNPDDLGYMEALSRDALAAAAPFATVNGNPGQGAVDVFAYGHSGARQLAAAQLTVPVLPTRPAPCLTVARPGTPLHPTLRPVPDIHTRCQ